MIPSGENKYSLQSKSRVIGDGHHVEPRSSDEDDTSAGTSLFILLHHVNRRSFSHDTSRPTGKSSVALG
ncbi:hypothetical protein TNCV_1511711 [Trichonephila clavipes]|nr:hypothetical protein TNCV_1511711 [Trichonephila clavipes]